MTKHKVANDKGITKIPKYEEALHAAESRTRLRLARVPPHLRREGGDEEFVGGEAEFEEFVEAFGVGWGLEDFVGAVDARDGDSGFANAAGVALEGGFHVGDEVVAGDVIAGGAGEAEVGFATGDGGVGVVDDEVAPSVEAVLDEAAFAGAGVREIHADAEMGAGEMAFVEGAFAGGLEADENDGVHACNVEQL